MKSYIYDFTNITYENIVGCVVNPDSMSTEILNSVPHRTADGLVVHYWIKKDEDRKRQYLLVSNDVAERLHYTEDDLFEFACRNAVTSIVVKSLVDALNESFGIDFEPTTYDKRIKMHLVTNKDIYYGAFCLCVHGIIEKIANDMDMNLIIIPSSKHELLVLNYECGIPLDNIKAMVYEINRTEVQPEDVLSDNIYIWKREDYRLTMY